MGSLLCSSVCFSLRLSFVSLLYIRTVTLDRILVCLFEHTVNDVFRILLVEGVVTNFALEEGDEVTCRLLGVESECILAFCCKSRVESEQMPVTRHCSSGQNRNRKEYY